VTLAKNVTCDCGTFISWYTGHVCATLTKIKSVSALKMFSLRKSSDKNYIEGIQDLRNTYSAKINKTFENFHSSP